MPSSPVRRWHDACAAESCFRAVYEGQLQSLGAEHPNTLMTMANLGHLLQHQGNLEAAKMLLEPALPKTIPARGADHPDSYQRQHFLALLRMEQGRLDEAVTLLQSASAGFAAHFGESNHPAK